MSNSRLYKPRRSWS